MDSAADIIKHLPSDYHYVFDLVHFILCIQGDRADIGPEFETTSKNNPLACWASAMMACFAGGLLVNPLCGEPILGALGDSYKLAMAQHYGLLCTIVHKILHIILAKCFQLA